INEFAPPEQPRKKKFVIWLVAGLAAVALVAVAVAAIISSWAKPTITQAPTGTTKPGNVVTAPPPAPQPGNVVTAPPAVPPPGSPMPAEVKKPKPPKEVIDYLDFVKRVEEHRQMLLKDTSEALMLSSTGSQAMTLLKLIDMAADPDSKVDIDPLKDAKNELVRQYKNWLSTLEYFDKKPAPDECREFSGAYRELLRRETEAIGRIAQGLLRVNIMDPNDMSRLLRELQRMKNDPSIQRNIDLAADNADAKLNELVAKYDMQKPFSVPREQQVSGSIMGF
ncbi:MAG: hypothetical protein QHI38_08375, partial [Armatimonadota bacterium]|nr:hypothetical protein [Armatimonadota bacterium]